MITLASCGGLSEDTGPAAGAGSLAESVDLSDASYIVGGKDFDEQLVLCEIAVAALQSTGAEVTNSCDVGGTNVTRQALVGGEIDLYWDYTGTAWVSFFGEEPIQDPAEQYQVVAKRDLQENDIHWLTPSGFNNTYAFAVLESKAAELNLRTQSDMAAFYRNGGTGPTCVESEYLNRADGLPGYQQTYEFQLPTDPTVLETNAVYAATANPADCLFGEVFTTDGRIKGLDLRVLEDDRSYHPFYNAAIAIRDDAYRQNPDVEKVFEPIATALTQEVMQTLNTRKSSEGVDQRTVAREWLQEMGFIGAAQG